MCQNDKNVVLKAPDNLISSSRHPISPVIEMVPLQCWNLFEPLNVSWKVDWIDWTHNGFPPFLSIGTLPYTTQRNTLVGIWKLHTNNIFKTIWKIPSISTTITPNVQWKVDFFSMWRLSLIWSWGHFIIGNAEKNNKNIVQFFFIVQPSITWKPLWDPRAGWFPVGFLVEMAVRPHLTNFASSKSFWLNGEFFAEISLQIHQRLFRLNFHNHRTWRALLCYLRMRIN